MTDEVVARALDLAFADDSERVQVSFFGGEPTLQWDKLVQRPCCRRAGGGQRQAAGAAHDERHARRRRACRFSRRARLLRRRQHRAGGRQAAHDAKRPTRCGGSSIDALVAGLDRLLARGPAVETISVVDPAKVAHPRELRFPCRARVERLAINPNFAAEWSDEALATWRRGYEAAADVYVERCLAGTPVYISAVEDKLVTFVKGGYTAGDRCASGSRRRRRGAVGQPCTRRAAFRRRGRRRQRAHRRRLERARRRAAPGARRAGGPGQRRVRRLRRPRSLRQLLRLRQPRRDRRARRRRWRAVLARADGDRGRRRRRDAAVEVARSQVRRARLRVEGGGDPHVATGGAKMPKQPTPWWRRIRRRRCPLWCPRRRMPTPSALHQPVQPGKVVADVPQPQMPGAPPPPRPPDPPKPPKPAWPAGKRWTRALTPVP